MTKRHFISFFFVTGMLFSLPFQGNASELVIVGTGAGMTVVKAVGKAFMTRNPGLKVLVPESIGSGGGIKQVGTDQRDIGRIARPIKDSEKKYGLTQMLFARLPIVFYVNLSVSLDNITAEQVCRVYSGTVRNWNELNGGNGLIRVIRRETGDSSLSVLLKDLPGFSDITRTDVAKTTFTDQETLNTCVRYENSIAYGTFADVKPIPGIKALSLSGISPSETRYPLAGPLYLIYKEKNYNGTLKKFVEFVRSGSADQAVLEAGGLPPI